VGSEPPDFSIWDCLYQRELFQVVANDLVHHQSPEIPNLGKKGYPKVLAKKDRRFLSVKC
jgi:hypothetical protein